MFSFPSEFYFNNCIYFKRDNTITRNYAGFTLIELAIVVSILGLVLVAGMGMVRPVMETRAQITTKTNLNRILDATAAYAHRNNRIPCPARFGGVEPFGAERGSGAAGTTMGSCDVNTAEGIVPFRTLGLSERDVIDGWGRFITYRVSPVFTRDPSAGLVHARCRREGVWFNTGGSILIGGGGGDVTISGNGNINLNAPGGRGGGGGGGGGATATNRNAEKARFCCPGIATHAAATDIQVRDESGVRFVPFDRAATGYDAVTEPFAAPATGFSPSTDNVTTPGVALISHGNNGLGAFTQSGARLPTAGASPLELENANGDRIIVVAPYSRAQGNRHFDDFVVWRTQDQLYVQVAGGSCALP